MTRQVIDVSEATAEFHTSKATDGRVLVISNARFRGKKIELKIGDDGVGNQILVKGGTALGLKRGAELSDFSEKFEFRSLTENRSFFDTIHKTYDEKISEMESLTERQKQTCVMALEALRRARTLKTLKPAARFELTRVANLALAQNIDVLDDAHKTLEVCAHAVAMGEASLHFMQGFLYGSTIGTPHKFYEGLSQNRKGLLQRPNQ